MVVSHEWHSNIANPKSPPRQGKSDTAVPSRPVVGIALSASQMLCRRSRPCCSNIVSMATLIILGIQPQAGFASLCRPATRGPTAAARTAAARSTAAETAATAATAAAETAARTGAHAHTIRRGRRRRWLPV